MRSIVYGSVKLRRTYAPRRVSVSDVVLSVGTVTGCDAAGMSAERSHLQRGHEKWWKRTGNRRGVLA